MGRCRQGFLGLAIVFSLIAPTFAAASSYRAVEGAEDSTIILPADFDKDRKHAVLVLLPYTGGTSADLFRWYYASSYPKRGADAPLLVLLDEKGKHRDYRSGAKWAETVREYESEIRLVLGDLATQYSIDPERIALGGFSMGGDLSWALALRNPQTFRGAVIMGSRCTWREPGGPSKLRDQGARVAFFMGSDDQRVRQSGIHAARDLLETAGVDVRYAELEDRRHLPVPAAAFWESVDWALGKKEPPKERNTADRVIAVKAADAPKVTTKTGGPTVAHLPAKMAMGAAPLPAVR